MTPSQSNSTRCPYCATDCLVGFGYCHCRCGQKTNLAPWNTHRSDGRPSMTLGQPNKYIRHHQCRAAFPVETAAPFKIEGVYC